MRFKNMRVQQSGLPVYTIQHVQMLPLEVSYIFRQCRKIIICLRLS